MGMLVIIKDWGVFQYKKINRLELSKILEENLVQSAFHHTPSWFSISSLICLSLCYPQQSQQIEYKKNSKENQSQFSLSMDMVNLSHAKKAQALASDLDYRTKLHHYTILSDDIQVQQAKKAYNLQSEVRQRGVGHGRHWWRVLCVFDRLKWTAYPLMQIIEFECQCLKE